MKDEGDVDSSFILHPSSFGPSLRAFLKEKLPAYMIPSAFVALDALPLTPGGKVDRRALPSPSQLRPEPDAAYVAPRTELERTIAQIWQETLRVERVGMHDNFFDLGGHSLLLVQVHSRLCELFSPNLAIIELFEHPTVSALAKHISQQQSIPSTTRPDAYQIGQAQEGKNRLKQRLAQRQRAESKD